MGRLKSTEAWKKTAQEIHNGKYDYSLWPDKVKADDKVIIICPEHGKFIQELRAHTGKKSQCPKCANIKRKQTMLDRYGVEYPYQSEEIQQKRAQTCLKNHGVDNPFKSKILLEKAKQTMMDRYGVEHSSYLPLVLEKRKKTWLEKYGVEYPAQNEQIKEKQKKTMLDRYGVEYPAQSEQIKEKQIKTTYERYGVEYATQRHISQDTFAKLKDRDWLVDQHHNKKKTMQQISEELGDIGNSSLGRYFSKHDIEIKYFQQSRGEKEVGSFVKSFGVDIITNVRNIISPYEIDIWIPTYNIGIEYNGEYWHSSIETKTKDMKKQVLCEENNIYLMTIWEWDWKNKRHQIEKMLEKTFLI